MTRAVRSRHYAAAFVGLLGTGVAGPLYAGDNLIDALTGGKVDLYLRYRFEFVEDGQPRVIPGTPPTLNGPLDAAYANTLRTALGYSTGLFYDFGAYVQFEDVRVADNDAYNDGGSNGVVDKAVVVDPEGTEIQQANLRYAGLLTPASSSVVRRLNIAKHHCIATSAISCGGRIGRASMDSGR